MKLTNMLVFIKIIIIREIKKQTITFLFRDFLYLAVWMGFLGQTDRQGILGTLGRYI